VDLRDEIVRLGPWHLDIDVTTQTSTRVSLEGEYAESLGPVSFLADRDRFQESLLAIFPNGLEGRSFLDCACNCGAYLFWAKEIGASRCFGFDAREHWIRQARFLLEHRDTGPKDGIEVAVCDLYDVPDLGLEPFDVTLFKGILYHLPDPIRGLRIAADLTRELLIVNTATRWGVPDGGFELRGWPPQVAMFGVHGLNLVPTGPGVVVSILKALGFVDTHVLWWLEDLSEPGYARTEIHASKKHGLLPLS
jgi:tRNA (mo5U34)-methyltransferase